MADAADAANHFLTADFADHADNALDDAIYQ
jgi:hypothetical protein